MTSEPRSPRHSAHLFIPAVRPELAAKAAATAASAIIVDLEDSVPATAKDEARTRLTGFVGTLRQAGKRVYVRVNNTELLLRDDVSAALEAGVDGMVIPKVETTAQLEQLDAWISDWEQAQGAADGSVELELQVETPAGLLMAPPLAAAVSRTTSMMLGVEDFCTELGVDPNDPEADLQWAHGQVLLAATAAGIAPYGLIGAFSNYRDTAAYAAAARRSRSFGYVGAYCIHPSQVAIAVDAFTPSAAQLNQARRILEAYEAAESAGRSATSLDGTMIDRPIAERAQRLLTRAAAQTPPATSPTKDRP
jgi:citrate lyase subunit beta/citryl-CoA lyase